MENYKNIKPVRVDKAKVVNLEKGKLPPQAVDLEEAVLGALMIDPRAFDELLQVFNNPEVFYRDSNKMIFEAIKQLSDASQPIDLLTVSSQLKQNNTLELVGGDYYLVGLTQKVGSSAHIEFHARIVLQMYMKRKAISVCSEIISMAYDVDTDVFQLFGYMDVETSKVNEIVDRGRIEMTYGDALDAVIKRVQMLTDSETCLTGVDTGFNKLNKHFGGWQPTDFIVVGARPGMGKTAFVVNTMLGAAKAGNAVGFISLEMSTEQLATRSVANESNFHLNQLTKTGFDKPEYFSGLIRKVNELRGLPIFIDDRPALTIGEIKRKARLYKRKNDIKVLIIDYIQLAGSDTSEDIRIRVGKISNGLKSIAKELNITVIGLAQLSREVEKAPMKRPSLHHLKESGDIEQDADAVCFIYRSAYYGFEVDNEVIDEDCNTEFIVAKYRHGGVGTIGLYYDENKTKFTDREVIAGEDSDEVNDELPKISPADAFDSNPVEDKPKDFDAF